MARPLIKRLLIANRGEIAVRIARGARECGISPVGVYSDADVDAPFRAAMDATLRIGPGPATESYLDGAAIVAAAKTLGADAVHPGYGFLSERAPFAQAVLDAGLVFVGPTPAAIAAMGSKIEAKLRVRAAGVPVVDGYDGADQTDDVLRREAAHIRLPLVIKASAGGGGRGMRVVDDLAGFDDALASARREARTSFGDDAVLLERYLRRPRHIEFQILGDVHGSIVHLGERECSIQRRHQKVVEEAPSVALDSELRERMGAAAVAAARSVAYTNAGTVEFMLDADGTFAFLEMNARLQVEHPVTELVYGIDLVHEQLRIAGGEPLRFAQADLRPRGWAVEVRLNAEDPGRGYAPAAGTIRRFSVPAAPGVRVDSGVADGTSVPMFYDSLLAKIIVWAEDRPAAIARLRETLGGVRVTGVATNLPLLRAIATDDAFAAGDTTTRFLDERPALAATVPRIDDALALAAGALLHAGYAWRIGGVGIPIALGHAGTSYGLVADRIETGWQLSGSIATTLDETLSSDAAIVRSDGVDVDLDGHRVIFDFPNPPSTVAAQAQVAAGSGTVTSPMPGRIVSVNVTAGDGVAARALLVVLEAMKMEHRIEAPSAGTVTSVRVAAGDVVAAGATLVTIGAA